MIIRNSDRDMNYRESLDQAATFKRSKYLSAAQTARRPSLSMQSSACVWGPSRLELRSNTANWWELGAGGLPPSLCVLGRSVYIGGAPRSYSAIPRFVPPSSYEPEIKKPFSIFPPDILNKNL